MPMKPNDRMSKCSFEFYKRWLRNLCLQIICCIILSVSQLPCRCRCPGFDKICCKTPTNVWLSKRNEKYMSICMICDFWIYLFKHSSKYLSNTFPYLWPSPPIVGVIAGVKWKQGHVSQLNLTSTAPQHESIKMNTLWNWKV